ncbi:hypothetical protein FF1_017956 [Malus domestica]
MGSREKRPPRWVVEGKARDLEQGSFMGSALRAEWQSYVSPPPSPRSLELRFHFCLSVDSDHGFYRIIFGLGVESGR